ncbi:hypothetical protein [Tautonia plasticadhaerens]|uniref:Uncharacterized protein n=1 Tax=Tautonia plasticadhaerens TaxID=2527974 RepID=A0A518H032_9BACT|nr:hypothetical protein [Tautonia plasticadhaerens]QDV34194.1 hypothetical protein ElP_20790 [Tautonia plasticadhaerens]
MARPPRTSWLCAVFASLLVAAPSPAQDGDPAGDRGTAGPGSPVIVVRPGVALDDVVRAAISGVTSVEVVGEVPRDGGLARVSMTLGLYARGTGPHRVPIGLDGLYPREAVTDGEPLGWEAEPPDGWFLVLPGGDSDDDEQRRTVRVDVVAPVRSIDERRGLTIAIPRAAETSLRLDLPGPVDEATFGDGAPLPIEPIDGGKRSRIEALLDSRDELDVRWLPHRDESAPQAPLLTGGGHIAIDVGDGVLTARSTWEIQVRRGEASSVDLLADPGDELLDVEVEGRSIAPELLADGRGRRLPFPRTLRKGDSVRVSVTTLRPIPPPEEGADGSAVPFGGHRFGGLIEQGGTLSIGRADGLRVIAEPSVDLRRIDPRDLREEIARSRPTIISAFRFADQPFGLRLRVGPVPAIVRASQRSLVVLDPGGRGARVESWLDYRAVRGQVFTARVRVPEGLEVERVGPPEAVASWDLVRSAGEPGGASPSGPSTIELTLASALREGQATPIRVELSGRARLDPDRAGSVPVFLPLDSAFDGGRLAVAASPDLEVAPADPDGPAGSPTESSPAAEPGPWLRVVLDPARVALWMRHESPIDAVPLDVSPRAPGSSSMVDQLVRVGRDGVDVQQDLTLYAQDGVLGRVDLAVPPELERGWELTDRGLVEQVEPIAAGHDGEPIRRLTLSQAAAGAPLKLRISYRVPGVDRLVPGEARPLEIPRIEVVDPPPAMPPRVEVAAGPGIELRTEGGGWSRPAENQWVTNPDGGDPLPIRGVWVRPPGAPADARPSLSATASTPASLPEAIATRLWIRSEQGADGGVRTSAWFRFDDHGPTLGFRLPAAAELDRVYLDGQPVTPEDLDALAAPGSYQLHLPAESARVVLLGLSYRLPREPSRTAWAPPTLLGGGRVLETLWEVRVPWSRALVGVPGRYSDENVWYWAGYVFKRRPGLSPGELAAWVAGPGATVDALGPPLSGGRIGDHGYLFGRPGDPAPLAPGISPRSVLVGACSGLVLLAGLSALVRHRHRGRVLPAAALVGLAALMAVNRSTAILAVQSSSVGWLLVAVAVLTRRAVDRRRPSARFGDPSGLGTATSSGVDSPSGGGPIGSAGSSPLVGSDDSTAIRARPPAIDPLPPGIDRPGPIDEAFDIPAPRAGREAS